ncbi:helix-turn-helix transcriptional regulator [Massilia sp. W12]|uniref:helix-turn-helix domain-containing protein n=1 Tax=Massilia sp. W12 TaxID=3126507 RepID=UPI0030D57FF7
MDEERNNSGGEVGLRLQALREALNLRQTDIAKMAGVTRSVWQKYEMGSVMPGSLALIKLAQSGVNLHWLLTGQGRMYAAAAKHEAADKARLEAAMRIVAQSVWLDGVRLDQGQHHTLVGWAMALLEQDLSDHSIALLLQRVYAGMQSSPATLRQTLLALPEAQLRDVLQDLPLLATLQRKA